MESKISKKLDFLDHATRGPDSYLA